MARQGVGRARVLAVWVLPAVMLLGGCDGDGFEGLAFGGPERANLVGFYTGTAEITDESDIAMSVPVGNASDAGFTFPVALRLDGDGGFVLRSFNYPVSSDPEARVCDGVWEVEGTSLEFFPNRACRVLPLSRYRIGRSYRQVLLLEASTSFQGAVGEDVSDIRVRLRLERD